MATQGDYAFNGQINADALQPILNGMLAKH